ncbi:MAG: hypothetical protein AVDCRST_MAG20-337, partial [uncultured Acidimicrobiales bacterium]
CCWRSIRTGRWPSWRRGATSASTSSPPRPPTFCAAPSATGRPGCGGPAPA